MIHRQLIDQFLSLKKFAIVGASQNREKYGNKVYRDLRKKGFQVFPVNPKAKEIEGDKCYSDLHSLPEKVDGIVIIVPPNLTESVVKSAKKEKINFVWMQPGAESAEAIKFCQENGINVIFNRCVMIESQEI